MARAPLPVESITTWVVRPDCGASVTFCGTVRDHAQGRQGVVGLEYEAYVEQAEPKMAAVAVAARRQWPELGRLALVHRVGDVALGEPSVVVAVSAPHRQEAFEAARYCIDTIKATVPIWKRETWAAGSDWAEGTHPLVPVEPPMGRAW